MRITVVSAHYPPNFVSGGTLQPQRLARGLRARGHDVRVFAGWLGDRKPLTTWDETDETGMPVRWISSGKWISWDEESNWYNPPVTEAFRSHLREFRPDIVHLHSLQSLGAGLLPVAKEEGARVVVTMHDFWWLCIRQFLVDPEYTPCCLVQQAGTCPCQSGETQRNHRTSTLAVLLESADLVLAPSARAAEVLAANGIAPGRLEVDENGLPEAIAAVLRNRRVPSSGRGGDVRFLYVGGPNPMKGVETLLDATDRLTSVPGWHLSAYGIADHLDETQRSVEPSVVEVHEPYGPDELESVMRGHDVLVLPSIARETHSLTTREALAAGIPVLCSDTPGPTEVIVDGVNGLVVPAADDVALAAAMRSLIEDTALLERLRAGACEPVAAPGIDDQVVGLERRFERLVAPREPAVDGGTPVAVRRSHRSAISSILFVCGIEGAPLRYRARLPAEAVGSLGVRSEVRHYRDPDLIRLVGASDVVVFYRVPATIQILELIAAAHGAGIPAVFDVDDLIFDPTIENEIPALERLPADEAALWRQGVERYRTTLEACDAYIGSTDFLVEHARTITGLPSYRFANGVGALVARCSEAALRRPRRSGSLRIGYLSGTKTHDDDWFSIEPAVIEILDKHPDVELWMGGHLPDSPPLGRFGGRIRRLPFVDWRELPGVLRDLDINLAPLSPGSRFNEAKSAIKWLEAALCATPTVASPTQPFREVIDPDRSGMLAETHDEWIAALDRLITDDALRLRIGALARNDALLRWSPAIQAARYLEILDEIVAARRDGSGSRSAGSRPRWTPVALDEPPIPGITLEPYADDDSGGDPLSRHRTDATTSGRLTRLAARIDGLVSRAVASYRSDGARSTIGKGIVKLWAKLARKTAGRA